MSTSLFVRRALSLSCVAVPLLAGTAHATGFLTDQFGNDHGQPALSNAYSVYFNPAAMVGSSGSDLIVDGVVAARTESFTRSASALSPASPSLVSDPTYREANTGQATLFNVLGAPYLGFVTDLGMERLRFGAAVYVPYGATVNWDRTQGFQGLSGAPGAYDGPQRWSVVSLSLASIYETVAVAYKFPDANFGVGANVSVIESQLITTFAHNIDGSDTTAIGNKLVEGRAFVNVSGVEVGASAGAYWEPTPKLHLGASYTSSPNFGSFRMSGSIKEYQGNQTINQNGDLVQAFPDVIRAGGAWRIAPDAELRLDLAWQRWSQFKTQCFVNPGTSCNLGANGSTTGSNVIVNLERNFTDTVRARFGGAYWIEPETELYGSFGVETSPVATKDVDPLVFDSVHLQGTVGTRHQFNRHIYGQLAYTYVYYLPVTVTDSALNTYQPPSRQPSENGSYASSLYIFDAALGYKF